MRLTKRKSQAELLKNLTEAVSKAVEKTLQKWEIEPHLLRSDCAPLARLVRRRLTNRRLWSHKIEPFLAQQKLVEIVEREMKRQDRIAANVSQIPLPGFEALPKRMRVWRLTVADLLVREASYEKRVHRNELVGGELKRLADKVRDQPPELSVPEALERANEAAEKAAKK